MSDHLTETEITLLIEAHPNVDDARVREHLGACERCLRIYLDALRHTGEFADGLDRFTGPPELIEAAKRMAGGAGPATSSGKTRLLFAAVAAAVVVLASAVWFAARFGAERAPGAEITGPIQVAINHASANGDMILPGGTDVVETGDVFRGTLDRELDASLAALREDKTDSKEFAYWRLSALVASARWPEANAFAIDAWRAYPDDHRIAVLAAIVDYHEGRLDEAERTFREVLEAEPGNGVAKFNLAVVLLKAGRLPEAERLFGTLVGKDNGSLVARRAQGLRGSAGQ